VGRGGGRRIWSRVEQTIEAVLDSTFGVVDSIDNEMIGSQSGVACKANHEIFRLY
jgi:hypothetical protein